MKKFKKYMSKLQQFGGNHTLKMNDEILFTILGDENKSNEIIKIKMINVKNKIAFICTDESLNTYNKILEIKDYKIYRDNIVIGDIFLNIESFDIIKSKMTDNEIDIINSIINMIEITITNSYYKFSQHDYKLGYVNTCLKHETKFLISNGCWYCNNFDVLFIDVKLYNKDIKDEMKRINLLSQIMLIIN